MATATKQSAPGQLARRSRNVRVPEPMEFVIFENNGAGYHWRIVAGDGAILVQSGSFASRDRAEDAARRVRDAAASARFDRALGELRPLDLAAGRDGPSDEVDAERWLDRAAASAARRWRDD